ncbi:TetR/AcrR family transcriptional regulator [Sphingobacterium faecale]|uniref:TetR/AcrR family transcriptional regulator n=1 Tax=Sphingobacterium faecale TaxID=2803775 RepID=A0ABS1R5D3_9SPHI|nr:TetR/AcrR family transcriptional regulator [Sphingobacterium faecale]MBL1409926.1 TetR/AcrR family transcriptional regulator [Sphingobacterium faecale]
MARIKTFDESEILQKAVELFWKQGYSATSPQELVGAMGISRSSLYNTYGDKKSLFLKALKRYVDTDTASFVSTLDSSNDAKTTIGNFLRSLITPKSLKTKPYGCFIINTNVEFSNYDREIQYVIDKNNKMIIEALSDLIARSQIKNLISNKTPSNQLALFIYNNIIGIRVSIRSGISDNLLKSTIEIVLKILN